MMRGTFANVRIENQLLDGTEGGYTIHHPTGEETTVFEASERYREDDTPLIVMAGEELGTGSSRDWAAKGTDLLGIRATIGQSYERIYRDNLLPGWASCPCSSKTARAGRNSASTGPRRSISAGSTTASNRTPNSPSSPKTMRARRPSST